MNGAKARSWFIASFLAPALLLYLVFVVTPGVRALLYSLQHWNGLGEAEYAGLANFRAMFAEGGLFLTALWHNLILMVVGGGCTLLLALFFASLLHRRIMGAALFRVAFFFPNVLAAVAIALLWTLLYSTTSFGVFNALLGAVRDATDFELVKLPFSFLDSKYLIFSMVPMVVWTATGFYMVLFLAAMQSIPETYYEAARIEGATSWQQFRFITLPLIRDVFSVAVVFLIISSLKFFDPVWVMENQQPQKESHVLATVLYQKVFSEYNVGHGAAVAVMLFVLIFGAALLSLRLNRAEGVEY